MIAHILFTERGALALHIASEIELIDWESYWDHYSQECRGELEALNALQQDKGEPHFEEVQRRYIKKLLATLWQNEGEVDYPVFLFGAAKKFLCTDQEHLEPSKTMHFILAVGGYHSWGYEYGEASDYPVEYLCLRVFQDTPLGMSSHDAINYASQMCNVAEKHLREERYCHGQWGDLLNRPYNLSESSAEDTYHEGKPTRRKSI